MRSILRDWVTDLPLRHQGTLLAAVRGCDGASKHDVSKPIIRALRYAFLHPADEREVGKANAYMSCAFSADQVRAFVGDMDGLPFHFVTHVMNAAQIVGYKHPDPGTRIGFSNLYATMVDKLHLRPEREDRMDSRLTASRIRGSELVEPEYER